MSVENFASALKALFATHNVPPSPELLEAISALAQSTYGVENSEAYLRFVAQFELVSGGPRELGEQDYQKVLDMAKVNLPEAIFHVEETYEWYIGVGPYVWSKDDPLDESGKVYWHPSFGEVESIEHAYGYVNKRDDKPMGEDWTLIRYARG